MIGSFALRHRIITWVDRAIDVQDATLRNYLSQAGGGNADDQTASDQAGALESQYLATVSGAGAAVGGAASIPGVGTGLAVGLSVAETVAFLDGTALFSLASAELRGYHVRDLPRRRALLLLVVLGDDAVRLVPPAADGETEGWGRRLMELDDASVAEINRTGEKWLLTRFGPRQGMVIVGRLVPFGIGAAVGAAGNALTAKGVIARVRAAFAGAPSQAAPPAAHSPAPAPARALAPAPTTAADVEAPTGKYASLYTLFQDLTGEEVVLTVGQLDDAVTGGLPAGARRSADWWGNEPTPRAPQSRAWLAAGLHVSDVDLTGEKIRLRRGPAPV